MILNIRFVDEKGNTINCEAVKISRDTSVGEMRRIAEKRMGKHYEYAKDVRAVNPKLWEVVAKPVSD